MSPAGDKVKTWQLKSVGMNSRWHFPVGKRLACALIVFLLAGVRGFAATPAAPLHSLHVVLLFSAGFGLPAHQKNAGAFLETLQAAGVPATNVHLEFLELVRNRSPSYRSQLPLWLAEKYRGLPVQAVVTVDGPAQDFMLREGKTLFPGVPLVSVLAPAALKEPVPERPVLQILPSPDFQGSLTMAAPLFPRRKHILCVIGASESERALVAEATEAFAAHSPGFTFEFTNTLTRQQMLARVEAAGDDTLVFFVSFYADSAGEEFIPRLVGAEVAKAAKAPVLITYDSLIDTDVFGGSVFGYGTEGRRAAQIVLDHVTARHRLEAPLETLDGLHRLVLNWKQVQRWQLENHPFPPDTEFFERPPSPWAEYRKQIVAAIVVFIIQSLTIFALLAQKVLRKRAERKLVESENRLRTLIEQAPDAIFLFDADENRFVEMNARAESLFGRSRQELLVMEPCELFSQLQPVPRPWEESFQEHLKETLNGGSPRFEWMIFTSDGQKRQCEVQLVKIPSESGNLVRASFLDISARKKAEGARSLFLASLSHELRTPLNAIIGFSEILLVLPSVPGKEKDYIRGIQTNALHLLKIISDLLAFASSENEEIRLESCSFDWNELLSETHSMVVPLVRDGVTLKFLHDTCRLWVKGDRLRILQVLLNVLSNAAKFTSKGKIELRSLAKFREEGLAIIEVTVSDTGIGISKEYLRRLFTPFSQQDGSLTRKYGGSGLGLSISRKFMTAMGGKIEIESLEGRGTSVFLRFELPRIDLEEQEGDEKEEAEV